MIQNLIGERVRLAIELALQSDDDPIVRLSLDKQAAQVGLCGAEIDAARMGKSFEVRTGALLALATAFSENERELRCNAARKAGVTADLCAAVEALAADIRSRARSNRRQ